MPRKSQLTWQSGTSRRKGRWRKKYRGKVYYFAAGRGKTDAEAYRAALGDWASLKQKIDGAAGKPHQADYESAIATWDQVLTWCRRHRDDTMANVAVEAIARLRAGLAEAKPKPVSKADLFEGRFDQAVRFPERERAMAEIIQFMNEREAVTKQGSTPERGGQLIQPVPLDSPDPLHLENAKWRDRLEVMRHEATPDDDAVTAHAKEFITAKQVEVDTGLLSIGRLENLRAHLAVFCEWLGGEMTASEITGQTLVDYRDHLLRKVQAGAWSRTTANERMSAVKSLVRWLWQRDIIEVLPRVMDTKAKALHIGASRSAVVTYTLDEIRVLLRGASDRTKLYILLMLNCGMTQKDISDLNHSELDLHQGRITRKRSKTRNHESVPEVSYLLWPETLRLLQNQRSQESSGAVLLNSNGSLLRVEKRDASGKYQKIDNVRTAFERLRKKLDIGKPLKSLKKTSASLLRGNKEFSGLEHLFLGHAATSMSDKHYTTAPQELLDEAITWLGEKYEIADCLVDETEPSPTPKSSRRKKGRRRRAVRPQQAK